MTTKQQKCKRFELLDTCLNIIGKTLVIHLRRPASRCISPLLKGVGLSTDFSGELLVFSEFIRNSDGSVSCLCATQLV